MQDRSPGVKLFVAGALGLVLLIPLMLVYGLVSDRQHQARVAQDSITQGWGGAQTVAGPVMVIPYRAERSTTEVVDGKSVTRTRMVREELFLSPQTQTARADIDPESRSKSIYETVTYLAQLEGTAVFVLPEDLSRSGVDRDQLLLDEVELRFGASDPRGLQSDARALVAGKALDLKPGNGPASTGGAGFHGFVEWGEDRSVRVEWSYSLRGSRSLALVPRGGSTEWTVTSSWPHPNFGGSFLPDSREITGSGFTATWSIANLALGQSVVSSTDFGPPILREDGGAYMAEPAVVPARDGASGPSMAATISLIEPVDVYSQVDRSVKYGFLFIGFTFLAYLMFDIIAGARVAAAEYLLTGVGLVLFFVLLLAFAEVTGFTIAYLVASGAIIALLTAYSAAILGSWVRARVIGGMLVGLYAVLYVLLSLEAFSLLIGSVLLFIALAGVMYATRNIEWGMAQEESLA